MEKVLPKCQCGQEVHAFFVQIPVNDWSGNLLSVDEDYIVMDKCHSCIHIEATHSVGLLHERDELPF